MIIKNFVPSTKMFEASRFVIESALRTSRFARNIRDYAQQAKLSPSSTKKLVSRMKELEIESVLDIGANVGQFGVDLRRHGFRGQIFSFEPIAHVAYELEKTALRNPPWEVIKSGLGAKSEFRIINVARNSALSSSFLEMLPTHLSAFPASYTEMKQEVKVSTLDEAVSDLKLNLHKSLIKIDVQGFESEVLKGGQETISKVPLCYFEASVVPLYRSELSLLDLLQEFSHLGHYLEDLFRGVVDPNGKLLQVDILTSRHD